MIITNKGFSHHFMRRENYWRRNETLYGWTVVDQYGQHNFDSEFAIDALHNIIEGMLDRDMGWGFNKSTLTLALLTALLVNIKP